MWQPRRSVAHTFVAATLLLATTCVEAQKPTGAPAPKKTDTQAARPNSNPGATSMLRESILRKEPAAALMARAAGPDANPEIISLLENPDAKVRRIAVYCLTETGGTDAGFAMVKMLSDSDPQVRGAAIAGLRARPDPALYKTLLANYKSVPDAPVRQQVAILIGSLAPASATEIRAVCGDEGEAEAREGVIAALARHGDPAAKAEFIKGLHASRGNVRARYLQQYSLYINQQWILPELLPILDDTTGLIWVGVDAHPEWPQSLRACDIAVNLISEIGKVRFSFPVRSIANYTPEQIAEAKAYLTKHKR